MYRSLLALLALVLVACQSVDSRPVEQVDHPALGPLVDRVTQSRIALQAAAGQFQSASQQLSELAAVSPSNAQAVVAATRRQYDDTVSAAVAVGTANAAVSEAAGTLTREWQIEIDVLTDTRLKADSQGDLAATLANYQSLMQLLRAAENEMDAVLAAINDTLQSLGAGSDAAVVASHAAEVAELQRSIDGLLRTLEDAIAGTSSFISSTE